MASSLNTPVYTVELWDLDGIFVADVSHMITGDLKYTVTSNAAETLSFSLDLVQYQNLLTKIGAVSQNILEPYVTDVKIRRNGQYLFGAEVAKIDYTFDNINSSVDVEAVGYLNYFNNRYITASDFSGNYSNKTYAQIAWNLINDTQSQLGGDFGVVLGTDSASVSQQSNRTRAEDYVDQNVKEGIVNLTQLESDNFDFWFTAHKEFNLSTRRGSDKPHIKLVYPENIASMTISRDATTIANKIVGIGSGFGEERLVSTATDASSVLTYKVRERVETFNSTQNQSTLDQSTAGRLEIYKDMYVVPEITLHDNSLDLNDVWIGDACTVRLDNSITTVNGLYRINKLDVTVKNTGAESVTAGLAVWE